MLLTGAIDYISLQRLAELTGTPVATLRRWCLDGTLPNARKRGRRWYSSVADHNAAIQGNPQNQSPEPRGHDPIDSNEIGDPVLGRSHAERVDLLRAALLYRERCKSGLVEEDRILSAGPKFWDCF